MQRYGILGAVFAVAIAAGSMSNGLIDEREASAAVAPEVYWVAPAYAYTGTTKPFTITFWGAYIDDDTVGQWDGLAKPSTRYGEISLDMTITPEMVATPGMHTIRLHSPNGTSAEFQFEVRDGSYVQPGIDGVNVSSIAAGAEFTLMIRGRDFGAGAEILLNGNPVPVTRNLGEAWVMAPNITIPAPGPLAISVRNAGPGNQNASFASNITVAAPNSSAPGLISVAPAQVQQGGPGFFLTTFLNSAFQAGTTLTLDGVELETVSFATNVLAAYVPAGMVQTLGAHEVRSKAPDDTLGPPSNITVVTTPPGVPQAPSINAIFREKRPGGQAVLFHSGGARGGYVTVDGEPVPSFANGTSFMNVGFSAAHFATPGVRQLRVVYPGAGGGTSLPFPFEIYETGDANCEDGTTIADALYVMRVVAGLEVADPSCAIGNIAGPGGLGIEDVVFIRRVVAGVN